MRLNKRISGSGFCSRRKAEAYIFTGKVTVNGFVVSSPAIDVNAQDVITIEGKELAWLPKPRLWIYYKPAGLITTHVDPYDRETVFNHLPPNMPSVISVGRLDLNSEGLLLLTNNGALARFLELPQNKFKRIYNVRAFGKVEMNKLTELGIGVVIEGVKYGKVIVRVLRGEGMNSWFEVVLYEGKNREIRKLFEYCDLKVNRLIRIAFGPYELDDLKASETREAVINLRF